jgi:hypothetical protein
MKSHYFEAGEVKYPRRRSEKNRKPKENRPFSGRRKPKETKPEKSKKNKR